MCQFWQVVESLVGSSEACCYLFVQSVGLPHLIMTMSFCSSYESNKSIVKILDHVASIKELKQSLQRQDLRDHLELIANSPCYSEYEVNDIVIVHI